MSDWIETAAAATALLYDSESLTTSHNLVDMNLGMGTWMRAPGEATGSVGLEIALDELAEKLNMDPIQLRLINYAENDPRQGHPWSSKHLRECYTQAADRFGWSKRTAQPGQHREGNKLIGYGMATANYGAGRSQSSASFLTAASSSVSAPRISAQEPTPSSPRPQPTHSPSTQPSSKLKLVTPRFPAPEAPAAQPPPPRSARQSTMPPCKPNSNSRSSQ
jgi:CO/xanthine dehydrogenase Mo-binding subunit